MAQASQSEKIVPAEQAARIEKVERARQVLQKTNIKVVLEALADMIEKTGEYYEMLGNLDKEYGKVIEAMRVFGDLPEVWEIFRQKVDKESMSTLFEVSVKLQLIAGDIQRWQTLSSDEKMTLGRTLKEIAKTYRSLINRPVS